MVNGAVTGKGKDEEGEFTLKGNVARDGSLSFKKKYKNKKVIEYEGKLHDKEINGKWSANGQTGVFSIKVGTI